MIIMLFLVDIDPAVSKVIRKGKFETHIDVTTRSLVIRSRLGWDVLGWLFLHCSYRFYLTLRKYIIW